MQVFCLLKDGLPRAEMLKPQHGCVLNESCLYICIRKRELDFSRLPVIHVFSHKKTHKTVAVLYVFHV